jgi:hypothetical protein
LPFIFILVQLQCWCLLQFQVAQQQTAGHARSGLKQAIWR